MSYYCTSKGYTVIGIIHNTSTANQGLIISGWTVWRHEVEARMLGMMKEQSPIKIQTYIDLCSLHLSWAMLFMVLSPAFIPLPVATVLGYKRFSRGSFSTSLLNFPPFLWIRNSISITPSNADCRFGVLETHEGYLTLSAMPLVSRPNKTT